MRANDSQAALVRARRRVVNLPWWVAGISTTGWLLTIPVLLLSLHWGPGTVDPRIYAHLPISVVIGGMIAIVQGFFVVEILSQRLWYPVLFQDSSPLATPGTVPLTIARRGILWAVSAVACPIVSLLLIIMGPDTGESERAGFALSVGGVGILFGFASAWMLGRIVIQPVEELGRAARRVGDGKFDTQIDMLRADEFGMLIEKFNHMVDGLRQKERSEELLGRNVGASVAKLLLKGGDDELAGLERTITVLFCDIRNFTPRCAASSPRDIVSMLNIFFNRMVQTVIAHHGIVNQFTGDGFMAMFGATNPSMTHADDGVTCGRQMLADLEEINQTLTETGLEGIKIGIGINTGSAIIGSIGAARRSCYTAVGDVVNVSARIESHTKLAGHPLLFSEETRTALTANSDAIALPPADLKGKTGPSTLYYLQPDPTER